MRDLRSPLDGLRSPFGASRGPTGPTNTVAPVVSGTATVGQTLSTTNGTWTGEGTITYAYQWLDDGAAISGATSSTYTLTAGEEGGFISCRVTATDDNGSTAATSNSIGPVAASSFSPADLFGVGDEGLFYDFSDTSSMFTDIAGTTGVTTTGDPIGKVNDLSGNGNHITAPSTAFRPTYTESGGLAYLAIGAASGERLDQWTLSGLSAVNELTLIVAYTSHSNTSTGNPIRIGSTVTGDYADILADTRFSSFRSNPEGVTVNNTSSADTTGAWFVSAIVKTGGGGTGTGAHYKYASGSGGLAETDPSLATFAADLATVGGAYGIRGDGSSIAAIFLIDKPISGTDLTNLVDWFRAKAGH